MAPKHHWGSKRNDVSSVPRALPFPWAARRRRHVLEIKSAGRCQWTQHTLFSKSIQKPTPSSDFIPSSSLFCLKKSWKHVGNSKTDSWRFIHPLNPLSGPQEYHEQQTNDRGKENWDQFSTLDAKQKRQELDMECGRAYFLSHGMQTFCNQTTAPDTPQSPSRNRATNANMSPERIGRTHIPYTP